MDMYGSGLLGHTYVGRDGREHDLAYSLKNAIAWVANKLEDSSWGLLEYKRLNPEGLANQSWKDSDTACLFSDGTPANYDGGIAAIELQGYAYDALQVGAELLVGTPMRRRCQALAKGIQDQLIPLFWMPGQSFFAQGLDRDSEGKTRQIDTLTSNPGLLLDSSILTGFPAETTKKYIEKVVATIMGPDFLAAAGVRSRAWRHHAMPGFVDYHGSYTVWPKETYAIAKGFRRHGFTSEANQLENHILTTVAGAGEFYEFFYAGADGKAWYNPKEAMASLKQASQPDRTPYEHPPMPEPAQAWTISAFMGCLENLQEKKGSQPGAVANDI
jgi:glycogen debranching enzyme